MEDFLCPLLTFHPKNSDIYCCINGQPTFPLSSENISPATINPRATFTLTQQIAQSL